MTTEDRTDVPSDAIDWRQLLDQLADVDGFDSMAGLLHASGVLVSDDQRHLSEDFDLDDITEDATVPMLRSMLTALVREDLVLHGAGDWHFWNGDLDSVLDELGKRVGVPYPLPLPEYVLPRRIPPCPTCNRTDRVSYRLVGMPPAPPAEFDTKRVIFEGCLMPDRPLPAFRCSRCGVDYDPPGLPEFDAWNLESEEAP